MDATAAVPSAAATRLERLLGYLGQDPDNPSLLSDVCEQALACGRHELAESCIVAGELLGPDAQGWGRRRARLCMVRGDLDAARIVLERLLAGDGDDPVLLHDLAYVHLLQGEAAEARDLLQPWVAEGSRSAALPPQALGWLQCQWLRACHHLGLLQEARDWTQRAQAAGRLQPDAAGVASLVAVDTDEAEAAATLADVALEADARQHEALLARGSLALAAGDPAGAARFLQPALERRPDDGRAWSTLGLASLLVRDFRAAGEQLERAVQALPDHGQTWQALGWARLAVGDHAGARIAFDAALRLDAQDATCGLARDLLAGSANSDEVQARLKDLLAQWRPRA
jgi:Flp pilus assembly protein TadD